MKLNYYLKKIQNLIFRKNFYYPKTIIDYIYRNKKVTVISFSSIGRGRKYIQQNEFFYLTKKYNVLFIKDITRSWFNNIDIKYNPNGSRILLSEWEDIKWEKYTNQYCQMMIVW